MALALCHHLAKEQRIYLSGPISFSLILLTSGRNGEGASLGGGGPGRESRIPRLVFSNQDLKSKRIWFTKGQELFPECEQEGEEWRIQDLTGPLCWDLSRKHGTTEYETGQGLILMPNPMLPALTSTPGIYFSSHSRPIQTVSSLNESEGTGFLRPFTATFQVKILILRNLNVCWSSQSIENREGLMEDKVSCPTFSIKQLQGTNPEFSAPSLSTLLPGQHVTYLIFPWF